MIRSLKAGDPIPPGEPRRYLSSHGYVRLRWKVGKRRYVEVYEHRVVDGVVTDAPQVHHHNRVKHDNRPENLELDYAPFVPRDELVAAAADPSVTSAKDLAARFGVPLPTIYRLMREYVSGSSPCVSAKMMWSSLGRSLVPRPASRCS